MMPSERSSSKLKSEISEKDGDKNRRHRLPDALPLETLPASNSKEEKDASHVLGSKTDGQSERSDHSISTVVPRSRSFFQQHDDRRTAARDGRHPGRRLTSERGWWKDSKDEERAALKTAPSDPEEREKKPRTQRVDNHFWRHDRFSEAEADAHPPAKKRRPFREEKVPLEAENGKNAVPDPSKVAHHPAGSAGGTGRSEERSRDRRPLERNEQDRAYARERPFSDRGRVNNSGFPSRDRFSGLGNDGRYKGRGNFGGRQGYRSSGTQVEKWKHDLYDEANRSPTPKNEEDPVAKVEALLSL